MNMGFHVNVSDNIKRSVEEFLQTNPEAKQIAETEKLLHDKKMELIDLEEKLSTLIKKRPETPIEYRPSINWCLKIDAGNPNYFLKSKEGLVKCVEYKHKIKLSQKQNNSFGATLSIMFKDGLVGRIEHLGVYFYGLPDFFNKDSDGYLTILKKKYEKDLSSLRQVNK